MLEKKISIFMYSCLVSFSSIFVSILLMNDINKPEYYGFLELLPISFALITLIFFNIYHHLFRNIGITLIFGLYFTRMVFVPFLMMLGNYDSFVTNISIYLQMNKAIFLIVYECFLVFLLISIIKNKKIKKTFNNIKNIEFKNDFMSKQYKFIVLILMMFLIICVVIYPQLKLYFKPFVSFNKQQAITNSINYHMLINTVPGIIYWPFTYVSEFMKFLFPLYLIINIKKKSLNYRKITKFYVVSLIIILFSTYITTPNNANSLIFAISTFILLLYLYKEKAKISVGFLIALAVTFCSIGLFFNSGINNSENYERFNELSKVFQAYFSGPANIAVALSLQGPPALTTVMGDFFNSIPFIGYFFQNIKNTPLIFNEILYGNSNAADQVIPLVGQGYFYFGLVISPLFSLISTWISVKSSNRIQYEDSYIRKYIYIYISVIFSIIPVLYNFNIAISSIGNMVFPMAICILLLNKKRRY